MGLFSAKTLDLGPVVVDGARPSVEHSAVEGLPYLEHWRDVRLPDFLHELLACVVSRGERLRQVVGSATTSSTPLLPDGRGVVSKSLPSSRAKEADFTCLHL